jgi:hypothetical protein
MGDEMCDRKKKGGLRLQQHRDSPETAEKDDGDGGGGATPSKRAGCRLAYGDQWIGGGE